MVVAATLLDLKAARLLPAGDVEDPEDLALLEARDLLFARLLQYRAFKQVAGWLATILAEQGRRLPRDVGVEPRFARLLPEVTIPIGLDRFAALAARALAPKQADVVSLAHLHTPVVSVRDQAVVITDRLRRARALTFRALTGDSPNLVTTVARFLALLELFREGAVAFEQLAALGELTIRWTGSEAGELDISDEFDDPGRYAPRRRGGPPMNPELSVFAGGQLSDADRSLSARRGWGAGGAAAAGRRADERHRLGSSGRGAGGEVAEALVELAAFYDETGRGFELREVGGGWRYYTREEYADLVRAYVLEGPRPAVRSRRWCRWR